MRAEDSDLRAMFPNSYGYVASVRKHAARIRAKAESESSIPVGASKLGGSPDFSAMLSWPFDGERPMSFLGQLRLEDLAPFDDDALLPHDGLILFFVAIGEGNAVKGRVLRASGDVDALVRTAMPKSPLDATRYTSCAVELSSIVSFPTPASPFIDVDAIHKKERAAYGELTRALDDDRGTARAPNHKVLGYISAADERNLQDGDTRLLLQLDRDPTPGFEFPGKIAFLGQDPDLRRGELGKVRAVIL
jgi:hypothetical protein